jgi:hypothetical protein
MLHQVKEQLDLETVSQLKNSLEATKANIRYWHNRSEKRMESEAKEELAYIQKLLNKKKVSPKQGNPPLGKQGNNFMAKDSMYSGLKHGGAYTIKHKLPTPPLFISYEGGRYIIRDARGVKWGSPWREESDAVKEMTKLNKNISPKQGNPPSFRKEEHFGLKVTNPDSNGYYAKFKGIGANNQGINSKVGEHLAPFKTRITKIITSSKGELDSATIYEAEKDGSFSKVGFVTATRNPDSTPNDPREIAQDLKILKAKQRLIKLEGGAMKNPSKSYMRSLESLSKLEASNKVARDLVHVLYDEYKSQGPVHIKSDLKHFFDIWGGYLTPGDKMWVKSKVDSFGASRHNPSSLESSRELVQEFHGRGADSIDDVFSDEKYPDSLAELGELRELSVILPNGKEEVTIKFPEENTSTILASAPGGKQYVLIGGDQSVDVEEFGIEETNEAKEWARKLVLGQVSKIVYFTDKHHLEGPKYQKNGCLYEHELGEEGGELPTLIYDPNNETLEIVGGSYITRAEGIRN